MCQPRLAVTRFNVPAKCHFGCLWNQRTIETLPHKDYLINRIISPSILSQLCDNVKREQENNQSIFVMKLCHPPSVACSRLNRNEKWRYVYFFLQRRRVWSWFCVFSSLCFWFLFFFAVTAFVDSRYRRSQRGFIIWNVQLNIFAQVLYTDTLPELKLLHIILTLTVKSCRVN